MLEPLTDVVFMPSDSEMYPDEIRYLGGGQGDYGAAGRGQPGPGISAAWLPSCNKLFNIVQPTRAYFGQKDAQQVAVIKKMVADLNMNLEVVVCPTVREPDGLAMSSRNTYLNPEQRRAAAVLYKALDAGAGAVVEG